MNHPLLKYILRFGGPILLIAAIIFYFLLSEFEREGGTFRSHVLIIWLYKTFGLWGTVLTMLGGSAFWFYVSIKHYLLKKNGKVSPDGENPNGVANMWC